MTKSLFLLTFLCVHVSLISLLFAHDAVNADEQKKAEINDLKARFLKLTGVEATPDSLLTVLKEKDVQGAKSLPLIIALKLVPDIAPDPSAFTPAILACFEQNSSVPVKLACLQSLILIDKEKGITASLPFIKDKENSLDARILVATYLINVENLQGYPLLEEGLIASSSFDRKIARELFHKFKKFDGKETKEDEIKINLSELLATVRKKTVDETILKELDTLEEKTVE